MAARNAADALEPMTASEAKIYQRLRGHLATLKLGAAAEMLTTVLDAARAEQLSTVATVERLLAVEVEVAEARRLVGRLRFACLPAPHQLADSPPSLASTRS